jgi:prepilin-type N-terminal cleavage/methylation domain-containing protein
MMMRKEKGFSLIELLIVVAIILIIAAIAIPNLLRSKMAANEASAMGSLRTIHTEAVTYFSTYGDGYPPTLANLGPPPGPGNPSCAFADLIDNVLAGGRRSGYIFAYAGQNAIVNPPPGCPAGWNVYTVNADPIVAGATGQRHFYVSNDGVIRFNMAVPAGPGDPEVQ